MADKYVIRGYHWGYNDETYYPCGSYIQSIFDNEESAKCAFISLERQHWSEMDLAETDVFFNGDKKTIEKLNHFVQEKTGKPLFTDLYDMGIHIPKELSDEDFMQFLKIADSHAYKLTHFTEEPKFYALWMPVDDDYLKEFDEYSSALVYGETIDELKKAAAEHLEYCWDEQDNKIEGQLNDLSSTPDLLKSFVDGTQSIKYNEEKGYIKFNPENTDDLFALNELLAEPLFEVRTLSLEEIQELEEGLGYEEM